MFYKQFAAATATLFACVSLIAVRPTFAQTTTRVNVGQGNAQSNNATFRPKISADGRYVVYASDASNLVTGDTNATTDIFITEVATRTTRCVSVSSAGAQATGGGSYSPTVSGDGRYVAFESGATNLIAGDTNGKFDIFVRDTVLNKTERVSVGIGGAESNGDSEFPVISRDGRYIAFESSASNLVTGDTNNVLDIFLYDRLLKKTTRVSVASDGTQSNADSLNSAISSNGRFVAYASNASNLVAGDTNFNPDVFIRDTVANTTTRVSVSSSGAEGDDASGSTGIFLSDNGQFVAFDSYATTLVMNDTNLNQDVFIRDTVAGTTTRVSVASDGTQADDIAYADGISGDGRYVLFDSPATNLVSGDTNLSIDCFLRDRQSNTTARVSLSNTNAQGNDESSYCDMTSDANSVAFFSFATNLVTGDTNGFSDIFVRVPLQTTAEVRGTLTLQNIDPAAPDQLITFTFHPTTGSDIVRTAAVSPNGAFTVNGLPRDTYTLLIKGGSYLAAKTAVNASAGNVTLPNPILLKAGDVNGDNFVDIQDLLLVIASYNKTVSDPGYSVMADFNLDGFNDISDLLALIANYNQQGDTLP